MNWNHSPFWAGWLAPSDEQLMARVQADNSHGAFALLAARWDRRLWRLCARMTGDPHRAEDLKQEALARLFDQRRDFRQGMRLSTWLWRITINLCHDEIRRKHRRRESPLDSADDGAGNDACPMVAPEAPPDAVLTAREEGDLVRQALEQLPELYRTVVVLRHYEGLKLREIAAVLKVPEGTVNSRMAEGLARLTRLLAPHFAPAKTTTALRSPATQPDLNAQIL